MLKLALVADYQAQEQGFEILLYGEPAARIVPAAIRSTPYPAIDLSLHAFFKGTGEVVDTAHGPLAEVVFSVLRKGRKHEVRGVAVALAAGTGIVFPVGFFDAEGR